MFNINNIQLPNDDCIKGKCGLKGLSYMACSVATIMNNVGVNSEIIEHGKNGFLVTTEQEWIDCLSQLIENKKLRQQLAEEGRKTVVEKYSVNANKVKYLKAFNSLIK